MAPSPHSARPRARRLLQAASGITGVLVGFFALGWAILWGLDQTGQRYSQVELDVTAAVRGLLRKQAKYDGPPRLVYLGDSLSADDLAGLRGLKSTPGELRHMLRLRAGKTPSTAVFNLSLPGLTAFSHYLASENLTRLNADRFIISVNPGWFSRGAILQQPSLAGLLPTSRWPEATRLPLHAIGLSADGLVLSHALMSWGYTKTWRDLQREQVRVQAARNRAAKTLQVALGDRRADYAQRINRHRVRQEQNGNRPTREGAERRWGPMLRGLPEDDPNLQVLDALVKRLRATGARVLLVATPTNVDVLEELGVYDRDGMQTSLNRIRDIATRNGADFLDVHDLLPDAAFRDAKDHLDLGSKMRPSRILAAEMVLWSEGNVESWNRVRPEPPSIGRPAPS